MLLFLRSIFSAAPSPLEWAREPNIELSGTQYIENIIKGWGCVASVTKDHVITTALSTVHIHFGSRSAHVIHSSLSCFNLHFDTKLPNMAAGRVPAFLVTHGSFNPVHRHHIEMMVRARQRLEEDPPLIDILMKEFMNRCPPSAQVAQAFF